MKTPLIDAAFLSECFDKAGPWLTAEYWDGLGEDLERRHVLVRDQWVTWPMFWDLAPATRRLSAQERLKWEPWLRRMQTFIEIEDMEALMNAATALESRPAWLIDWLTYWAHLRHPHIVWWARWVYSPVSQTGALALVIDNPTVLAGQPLAHLYRTISEASRHLDAVLDSMRVLPEALAPFRTVVALAVIYSVYMFTMASWKLSQEFTQVLPSFDVVVRILLGLNRWEGKSVG
jgi:hypothetical protein